MRTVTSVEIVIWVLIATATVLLLLLGGGFFGE